MTTSKDLILFCRKCKKETHHDWKMYGVICSKCQIFTSHYDVELNFNIESIDYTNNK